MKRNPGSGLELQIIMSFLITADFIIFSVRLVGCEPTQFRIVCVHYAQFYDQEICIACVQCAVSLMEVYYMINQVNSYQILSI